MPQRILASGRLSLNEMLKLQWYFQGKWFILINLAFSLMLLTFFGFRILDMGFERNIFAVSIGLALICTMVVVNYYLMIGKQRKKLRRNADAELEEFLHQEIKITEDELRVATDHGASILKWEAFVKYAELPNVTVLYLENHIAAPYTRSLFKNDDDWNCFNEIVRLKVKKGSR